MDKVLSVVIPSYNVERFLRQTLDSFLDERILKDIENNYPFYFVNANTDFLGIFANKVVIESLDYVE